MATRRKDYTTRRKIEGATLNPDGTASWNGRFFNQSRVQDIIRRGKAGRSMGFAEQAVYDAVVGREEALQQQETLRVKTNTARMKALGIKSGLGYESYLRQKGITEADIARLSDEEIKAYEETVEAERKFNESERGKQLEAERKAKAKAEEDERKRQDNNLIYNLHESAPLMSDAEYKDIRGGKKVWAQDPEILHEFENERANIDAQYREGVLDDEEYEQMISMLNEKIAKSPYSLRDNPKRRTIEQKRAQAEENNGFYEDDDNKIQYMDSGKVEREKEKLEILKANQAIAQERQQMAKEKADNAPDKARKDSMMKELLKAKKAWEEDPTKKTPFDVQKFVDDYNEAYDSIYGASTPDNAMVCPECGASFTGEVCPECGWTPIPVEEIPTEEIPEEVIDEPAPVTTSRLKKSYL